MKILTKQESSAKPLIELLIAGLFWGFGFIATVWSLKFISFGAIIAYRSIGAFLFGLPFILKYGKQLKNELRLAFWPGLFLSLTLSWQAWGLVNTSATKSAFITTLYVIIVPVVSFFFLKKPLQKKHWFYVLLSLVGVALITELHDLSMNQGDLLTLVAAFLAAIHILIIDSVIRKSKSYFALNVMQFFWCSLFTLPWLLVDSRSDLSLLDTKAWLGMMSLTLGSSLLAFYLQLKAQERLSPAVASVLFLLESPFTLILAFLFLNETLNFTQAAGAALIFATCVATSRE